ncbi:MAG: hypothetical protein ACE5QW_06750 [Thermoplasmata archaeon]
MKRDSTYTFRKGRPIDSFASIKSSFTYSDVMQFIEQDEIVTRRDDEPFYIGVNNMECEILTPREAVVA